MFRSNQFNRLTDPQHNFVPNSSSLMHQGNYPTTDGSHHENQAPESFTCPSTFSTHGYADLHCWNVAPTLSESIRLQTGSLPWSNAFALCPVGALSSINGGFPIHEEGLITVLPMVDQPMLSDSFRYGSECSHLTHSCIELQESTSTLRPRGCSMLSYEMLMEIGSCNGGKPAGMMQDTSRLRFNESCPIGHERLGVGISDRVIQQQIEAGFGTFNSEPLLEYPAQPLITGNQTCFEEIGWHITSLPSNTLEEVFQSHEDARSEVKDTVSLSARNYQTILPLADPSLELNYSITGKRDCSQLESALDTSKPSAKKIKASFYREIAPKGIISSKNTANNVETTSADSASRPHSKKGGRNKPLSPEKSKKATNMRKERACARCFISHVECTEHLVCLTCQRKIEKAAIGSPYCLRGPLQLWSELFFPPLLSGHINQWFINNWIKENGFTFTNNHIRATLSSDPFGCSMPLIVHEVTTPNQSCLQVSDLVARPENEFQGFATKYTLPYGYNGNMEQLRRRCLEYVNTVSRNPMNDIEDIIGDTSGIVWKVLKAVWSFDRINSVCRKERVLHKGVNAFWMDYMMDRRFDLMHDSAVEVIQNFHVPPIVFSPPSAALLNRQIKLAIHLELETSIRDLLEELERHSRRTRASWNICFCINLILCILVELVQIAIDAMVIDQVSKGKDAAEMRKKGNQACQALEELPMQYSWILFKRFKGSYNPVKKLPVDNESGQNQGELQLMSSMRQLLHDHDDEMADKIIEPCLGGCSENYTDHAIFRSRNSGRHLSRFLRQVCLPPSEMEFLARGSKM